MIEEVLRSAAAALLPPHRQPGHRAQRRPHQGGRQGLALVPGAPTGMRSAFKDADKFDVGRAPNRPRRLRHRRALLPRRQPRPPRAQRAVRGARRAACPTSAPDGPPSACARTSSKRHQIDAGPVHPEGRGKTMAVSQGSSPERGRPCPHRRAERASRPPRTGCAAGGRSPGRLRRHGSRERSSRTSGYVSIALRRASRTRAGGDARTPPESPLCSWGPPVVVRSGHGPGGDPL